MSADPKGKDQVMKLIEHCCIKNKWGSLSFFNGTLREIIFMDYLLMKIRRIVEDNIALRMHMYQFRTNLYKAYAKDEIIVLSIQQ